MSPELQSLYKKAEQPGCDGIYLLGQQLGSGGILDSSYGSSPLILVLQKLSKKAEQPDGGILDFMTEFEDDSLEKIVPSISFNLIKNF